MHADRGYVLGGEELGGGQAHRSREEPPSDTAKEETRNRREFIRGAKDAEKSEESWLEIDYLNT